jgi:NADH:ubiquinone oxidoreductase subunit K/NADH:ubiquinone oxidoreductase subunit 6 (subunit J)
MNLVGNIFFALMSMIALLGAVVTVGSRNPIRSAVGLLATIVGIAGLFLRLNAEFMAAIQLIVYAGAVVVLFVFVVMLLGPDASAVPDGAPKARTSRALAGILMAVFAGLTGFFVLGSYKTQTAFAPVSSSHGSVEAVGRELFTKNLVPFELGRHRGRALERREASEAGERQARGAPALPWAAPPARRRTPVDQGGRLMFSSLGSVVEHYVLLSGVIFTLGAIGFLVRRNVLVQLMSIELMLNAVNLLLVAFNRVHPGNMGGQIFAFFIIAVAAAEAAVGLAIVLAFYRLKQTVMSDEGDQLKL